MAKSKQHNKKPGIKDVVKVVSSIIQELQICQERINELYGVIDVYIEFKKDNKKWLEWSNKQVKESQDSQIKSKKTPTSSKKKKVG